MAGVFIAMIMLAVIGCNDAGDRPGNLLTDPERSYGGKLDGGIMEDSTLVTPDSTAISPNYDWDSTAGNGTGTGTTPNPNHVENGPDRTRMTPSSMHITSGPDLSKYIVVAHIVGGTQRSRMGAFIYEHIVFGADRSKYKPKGGTHITSGPDQSLYQGGTPAGPIH
jgi:hypothetical protein